jgi:hypothetical protein
MVNGAKLAKYNVIVTKQYYITTSNYIRWDTNQWIIGVKSPK